ncbi:Arm DNA-binding domain-containing protein [Eikenella corrodens]|uniref:Arm DNA-binding domain-containing protein n=1 Tax=Eikenella corrodens TaxID=539 RepID=UPI000668D6BE|nr:Arm DNA-binding domain-containing protein [Eikenella corrodens]
MKQQNFYGIFYGILKIPPKNTVKMPLTDRQIKNAKPTDKAYKLTDGSGLYLQVTPAGGKLWRFDYAIANKRPLQKSPFLDSRSPNPGFRLFFVPNLPFFLPGYLIIRHTGRLLGGNRHT